jgi:hypothetical protein
MSDLPVAGDALVLPGDFDRYMERDLARARAIRLRYLLQALERLRPDNAVAEFVAAAQKIFKQNANSSCHISRAFSVFCDPNSRRRQLFEQALLTMSGWRLPGFL